MTLTNAQIERRSLEVGKWGNLLMAVAGVAAAMLSHSDALLVDGLYSGVNFISAIIAAQISLAVARPADRRYPLGYDAYEAIYVTFRSLVLLGIMAFAVFNAVHKIFVYASGGDVPELVFGPIFVYAVAMVVICFALAAWHQRNWRLSGGQSEILQTESRAAVVDGVISGGAGGGLAAAGLLTGTALDFLVPVADSIIVLIMCALIVRQPAVMFLGALNEIAGASADPATIEKTRTTVAERLQNRPFQLLEIVVTKIGRSHFVISYIKPEQPITGDEADQLWKELNEAIQATLGQVSTEIIIAGKSPYDD